MLFNWKLRELQGHLVVAKEKWPHGPTNLFLGGIIPMDLFNKVTQTLENWLTIPPKGSQPTEKLPGRAFLKAFLRGPNPFFPKGFF